MLRPTPCWRPGERLGPLSPPGWRRLSPGVPAGATACVVLLCAGAVASCTVPSDEHRFPPNPEKLRILSTSPEQDATGISSDVQVDLCLSGLVDPRTVAHADATLSSGPSRFDSALSVQLVPWTAPGGAELPDHSEHPWCRGSVLSITPRSPLPGGVLYRVRLRPAPVGWGGESLDTDTAGWVEDEDGVHYIVEFTVAEQDPERERDERVPTTLGDLFSPGSVFDPEREACGCHAQKGELAGALLDLRTPESAFENLVVNTRRRETGFPMVTPRRPSESFLIHKLLRDDHGEPIGGVLGGPMPPADPLPYRDLVQIARWIESGATLDHD